MIRISRLNKAVRSGLWIILFALIGFTVGYLGMKYATELEMPNWSFGWFPLDILITSLMMISFLAGGASLVYYLQFRAAEDEDQKEKKLSHALYVNPFGLYIANSTMLLFLAHIMNAELDSDLSMGMFILALALMIFNFFMQRLLIRSFNQLYPKRTIDLSAAPSDNTQKSYIDKLDEAERYLVYKSSFAAYNNTNIALYVLAIITFFYSILNGLQVFPFLILITLYVVLNWSYLKEAGKHYKF